MQVFTASETGDLVPKEVPLPLPVDHDEKLAVIVGRQSLRLHNCSLPSGLNQQKVRECGVDFTLWLPHWLKVPKLTSSRSKSHAKYIAEGDIRLDGKNCGVLLQVLPAGRETSCHTHPPVPEFDHNGTVEYFMPIEHSPGLVAELYTGNGIHHPLPSEGCHIHIGKPHQLQAPVRGFTLTLIFMWPIPHVRWMAGHVIHEPPFVAYTVADIPVATRLS